jgi:hypothetical protein
METKIEKRFGFDGLANRLKSYLGKVLSYASHRNSRPADWNVEVREVKTICNPFSLRH